MKDDMSTTEITLCGEPIALPSTTTGARFWPDRMAELVACLWASAEEPLYFPAPASLAGHPLVRFTEDK